MTNNEAPNAPSEKVERSLLQRILGKEGGQVAIVIFLLLCVYLFGYRQMRFFLVPSASMENTLLRGDQIVTMNQTEYQRGDIIVYKDLRDDGNNVKRIVGIAGDSIEVRGGALYINGQYISEPYIRELMDYVIQPPIVVPEGHVFVLGDNRNISDDGHTSREAVPIDRIVGKVSHIYYPYDRLGKVRNYPLQIIQTTQ